MNNRNKKVRVSYHNRLMAIKAYFIMNEEIYHNLKHVVMVMLNKMSKGRGSNREHDPNGGKLGKLKETHRSPTS